MAERKKKRSAGRVPGTKDRMNTKFKAPGTKDKNTIKKRSRLKPRKKRAM